MEKRPNEALNRMDASTFRASEKLAVWIVLDNVRSQHNIGSIFRSADAFRVEGISLCGITAIPPHREIHKTALGAEDSMFWQYHQDSLQAVLALQEKGYAIVAVEQAYGSVLLQDYLPLAGKKLALVFGNEVNGVADNIMAIADTCIEIPQFGTKHSVNIAVSAGIVLWELVKKMNGLEELSKPIT